MTENYDVIIIGSGAGGGTLAHALADSGKRILLLERGDFLPRELDNWDPKPVFRGGKYISKDTWYDRDGKAFPSIGAVNPGLTAMANALRVGDHIRSRMA
jgi:choline dehydrogenase-like flavoprotein